MIISALEESNLAWEIEEQLIPPNRLYQETDSLLHNCESYRDVVLFPGCERRGTGHSLGLTH